MRPQAFENGRVKVAILGAGNVATDLAYKLAKEPEYMKLALVSGVDPESEGLKRAREMGADSSHGGIDAILEDPETKIVFDATTAKAHVRHAKILKEAGKVAVDLTPAAVGTYVVPAVNLNECLDRDNLNLLSCGVQAAAPLVRAVSEVAPTLYAEVVSTIAGVSAGPGTRRNISRLDELEEPASLVELRDKLGAMLPRVDLPELLLEMHERTGFAAAFTHVAEGGHRVEDLPRSVGAVLVAEACNVGLEPLVEARNPALTRSRLSWVAQNYFRADTLTEANALLVDAQAGIPLTEVWGGEELASVDGLRFVVPVRTINAGPNPKYFRHGRGITYLNYVSDKSTGFHGMVPRDIAGLLIRAGRLAGEPDRVGARRDNL